jgi:hypothetical protein
MPTYESLLYRWFPSVLKAITIIHPAGASISRFAVAVSRFRFAVGTGTERPSAFAILRSVRSSPCVAFARPSA